jgi:NDP-sugar pyrophosphorylase family protein
MKALILAGGKSERMGGYPKCLSFVNGKTVFERQIEWLKKGGLSFDDILVSYGNRKEVYDYARRVINEKNLFPDPEGITVGDAGVIKLALERCNKEDEILISMNGDVLPMFDINLLLDCCIHRKKVFVDREKIVGSIVIKPFKSHLGIVRIKEEDENFIKITSFEEKPIIEDIWCSCGIYIFFLDGKDIIKSILPDKGDFARDVLSQNFSRFVSHLIKENEWMAIETIKDIRVAEELTEEDRNEEN